MIMFASNGAVDKIYCTGANGSYSAVRATAGIYLLVGRREEVDSNQGNALSESTTANMNNIYDLNSLWVGINGSTGTIVVTDNAAYPSPPATTPGALLAISRTFARQSDAMGGK